MSFIWLVIVSFPLDEDPNVSVIAWTTTPWTLPSNIALCVHPDFNYVKVKGKNYLLLDLDIFWVVTLLNSVEY